MRRMDFSGEWISAYSYHEGGNAGEHTLVFNTDGPVLVAQSLPQSDGSELTLRLEHDYENTSLTGTWCEVTSPGGRYRGDVFHGALQLVLDKAGVQAEGLWVGYNSDRTHVISGNWTLRKKS